MVHEIGNRTYIVADVDPLDLDGVRTMQVGTALWALAFVLLLPFYDRLRRPTTCGGCGPASPASVSGCRLGPLPPAPQRPHEAHRQ